MKQEKTNNINVASGGDFPPFPMGGNVNTLTMPDGTGVRVGHWKPYHYSDKDEVLKGTVLLVGGRREFMEKHGEFIHDFLTRGYEVYSLDNRGQGLSDRPLDDPQKCHVNDFNEFTSDLDFYIRERILKEKAVGTPLILAAHSMGSHIAFRYLHDHPDVFDKALLLSPMLGLHFSGPVVRILVRMIVWIAVLIGMGRFFAIGQKGPRTETERKIAQKVLTHDTDRYEREARILQDNPHLYVGGVTFSWVKAAIRSLRQIRAKGYVDKIKTPTRVFLSEEERVVDNRRTLWLLEGYDQIEVSFIENARHEIYRESDDIRADLWNEIDQFLEK